MIKFCICIILANSAASDRLKNSVSVWQISHQKTLRQCGAAVIFTRSNSIVTVLFNFIAVFSRAFRLSFFNTARIQDLMISCVECEFWCAAENLNKREARPCNCESSELHLFRRAAKFHSNSWYVFASPVRLASATLALDTISNTPRWASVAVRLFCVECAWLFWLNPLLLFPCR